MPALWRALFLVLPGAAWAHAPTAGIDGFYGGLGHPFTVPGAVLGVIAFGLVTGQRGDATFVTTWPAFMAATLVGLALALITAIPVEPNLVLLGFAALAGLLAATALTLPRAGAIALAALAGLLIGAAAAPDPGPLGPSVVTAGGTLAAAAVLYLFAAGLVLTVRERFDRPWLAVGLRVVGSWIVAIAALMAALSFAQLPPAASTSGCRQCAPSDTVRIAATTSLEQATDR